MKCPKCYRDTYSKKWGTCTGCLNDASVTKVPNNVTPVTKTKSHEEAKVGTHTGAGNLGVAPLSGSTVPSLLPRRGRPKKYASNAEKQRAYRERSR